MDLSPLHPIFVHMPIALSVINPLIALTVVIAIYKKAVPVRSWFLVMGLQAVLALSGFIAEQTGTQDRPHVETVISAELIEEHYEWGEKFNSVAWLLLLISGFGFLDKKVSFGFRIATIVCGFALLFLTYQCGSSGGKLVFEHGGAKAFFKEK